MPGVPYRVLVTVSSLTAVGAIAMVVGQVEIALVAVGALAGYLGRVNGSS